MPTYKEISKIKDELLTLREKKVKGSLTKQQENLYESLIDDFVKVAKDKVEGKSVNLYSLQNTLKKLYNNDFPETFAEVVKSSYSINNLNFQYFSTLVDTNRLDEIKDKTAKVINKSLGITEKGKLITNGFIDKAIENKAVQKRFAKEVNVILDGSPDVKLMQHKLKEFINGNEASTGLLERYYRTFANDLIANIDRTGSLVYADELELTSFYYAGGLISSSRSFCELRNGKIFNREEAERWSNTPFIKDMYKTNINDYVPLIDMGGYGCRHRADFITDDLAKAKKKKK